MITGRTDIRYLSTLPIIAVLLFAVIAGSPGMAGAEWMGRYSSLMSNPFNWTTTLRPSNGGNLEFNELVPFYIYHPVEDYTELDLRPPFTFNVTNDYLDSVNRIDIHGSYTISGDKVTVGEGGVQISLGYDGGYCGGIYHGARLDLDLSLPGQRIFEISNTCGYEVTLAGVIDGPGGITKTGNGKLVLGDKIKLFTGSLIVQEGNLCVDVMTVPDVTEVQGGTLSGNGMVHNITVANGARLYPGSSGITDFGNVIFASGSKFKVTIATPESAGIDAGKLIIDGGGSVNLGSGTTVFEPEFLATPPSGQSYTIIEGAGSITGYFADLPEGGTGVAGNIHYEITYQGGSGNDVVITVIGAPIFTTSKIYAQYKSYYYGQNPLILLEVTSLYTNERPCGSAEYSLDGLPFESCELSFGGTNMSKCQIELVSPPAGTHTLTHRYPGCDNFGPSFAEDPTAFVVNKVSPAINFTSSAPSIAAGEYVTLTFEALAYGGDALPPTGVVIFKDNGVELPDCTQTLNELGAATCFVSPAETGLHTISVEYAGDNNYNPVIRNLQGGLTVNVSPAITSADNTVFIAGTPGSFTLTTTGYPVPSLAVVSGTLPDGVGFTDNNDGTATLSGTPATVGAKGNYTVTITATNGIGPDGVQEFTLRVEKPEIRLVGNGLLISDNDMTPRIADNTDFMSVAVNGESDSRDYLVKNRGNIDLLLTSTPAVTVGGANPEDFTVTTQPASCIPASSSSKITIIFEPSDTGLRSATVSISNNDADENPYDFAIQGTGTFPAEEQEFPWMLFMPAIIGGYSK